MLEDFKGIIENHFPKVLSGLCAYFYYVGYSMWYFWDNNFHTAPFIKPDITWLIFLSIVGFVLLYGMMLASQGFFIFIKFICHKLSWRKNAPAVLYGVALCVALAVLYFSSQIRDKIIIFNLFSFILLTAIILDGRRGGKLKLAILLAALVFFLVFYPGVAQAVFAKLPLVKPFKTEKRLEVITKSPLGSMKKVDEEGEKKERDAKRKGDEPVSDGYFLNTYAVRLFKREGGNYVLQVKETEADSKRFLIIPSRDVVRMNLIVNKEKRD